jgi:hypothetical protein
MQMSQHLNIDIGERIQGIEVEPADFGDYGLL